MMIADFTKIFLVGSARSEVQLRYFPKNHVKIIKALGEM